MKTIGVLFVLMVFVSQSVFAANVKYLAKYNCSEIGFKEPLPSNFNEQACQEGYLAGYNDLYGEERSEKNNVDQQAKEYALGSNDTSLIAWFKKGYALAGNLKDYNACLPKDYCTAKTINADLKKVFDTESKVNGCKAGYAAFQNTRDDVFDYRSLIEVVTDAINHLEGYENTYKESYHLGALQSWCCQSMQP